MTQNHMIYCVVALSLFFLSFAAILIDLYASYYSDYKEALSTDAELPNKPDFDFIGVTMNSIFIGGAWPIVLPVVLVFALFSGIEFLLQKSSFSLASYIEKKACNKVSKAVLLTSKREEIRKLGLK